MADYYTLLTNDGLAYETARKAAGLPIKLTKMSVGDGNGAVYNPDATATALRREVWRGDINALLQDPNNSSWLIAELTIPDSVGGWYVREAGIWTDTGVLYAVVKYPESFKPVLATSGSGKEFYLRAIFQTSNAASVTLQVDETVVKATRAWVTDFVANELAKRDAKQSARVATVGPITLSGAQTIDGVAVVAGDRVLVKDQAAASANGLYVAAVGAWTRSTDADTSAKVTPGLLVAIEEGTANGDTLWQLVTDGAIVLGTTALAFVPFYNGAQLAVMLALKANLASPTFTGDPKAPTPARFDNDTSLATTNFAKAMGLEFSAIKDIDAVGATLVADDVGKVIRINIPATGAVVLPALSALPVGATLLLKNASTWSQVVVTPAGADTLVQALTLPPLCSALLVARPETSSWSMVGGSADAVVALAGGVAGQWSHRNKLINGNFDIWQRGFSFAGPGYSADRWRIETISNVTVSQGVAAAPYGKYSLLITPKSATNELSIAQPLDASMALTFAGKKATFSFQTNSGVAQTITAYIQKAPVANQAFVASGWTTVGYKVCKVAPGAQAFSLTVDIPNDGSAVGLRVAFAVNNAANGVGIGIWGCQLEEGAVATPFEFRQNELSLCQAYFESGNFGFEAYGASGNYGAYWHDFKVSKRTVPTMILEALTQSSAVSPAYSSSATAQGWQPRAQWNRSDQGAFYGFFKADAEL